MFDGEALEACLEVIRVLEDLHVDYFVAGSLASSFHGTPRTTNDADLVADLKFAHVPLLAGALADRFYVDRDRIREAIRDRSSFNVIFLPTMLKVDVFVLTEDPLARQEMLRRRRTIIDPSSERAIDVASAEDTILQKLAWYRRGGEVSDRQWHDLLGVLKVQHRALDREYLDRWAAHLEVEDLLARALREAGIE